MALIWLKKFTHTKKKKPRKGKKVFEAAEVRSERREGRRSTGSSAA